MVGLIEIRYTKKKKHQFLYAEHSNELTAIGIVVLCFATYVLLAGIFALIQCSRLGCTVKRLCMGRDVAHRPERKMEQLDLR